MSNDIDDPVLCQKHLDEVKRHSQLVGQPGQISEREPEQIINNIGQPIQKRIGFGKRNNCAYFLHNNLTSSGYAKGKLEVIN